MTEFETDLQEIAKPDIEAPIYRQNLRRSLLRAAEMEQMRQGVRWALPAAMFAAGMFGALVVLFVLRPDVPDEINRYFSGKSHVTDSPAVYAANRNQTETTRAYPTATPGLNAASLNSTSDIDVVSAWLANQKQQGLQVRVLDEGMLKVRRIIAEDGREVLFYTPVKDKDQNIY